MVSKLLAAPAPAADALILRLAEELHREATGSGSPRHAGVSPWCATLSERQSKPGADAAMRDILDAARDIVAANPLRLMPQVGLNVASALCAAADPAGVLAFPGRLVEAGGRIVSPAPPAFGGSGHLARCLLELRSAHGVFRNVGKNDAADVASRAPSSPRPSALANVRGGADVVRAAKRLGWHVMPIARNGKEDAEGPFRRAARKQPAADAFHDAGAIGIEACLYIPAADARTAAARILRLHETLVNL